MTTTLVLVRHGEIVRPRGTSNFDRAPLSERGMRQMQALVAAWPAGAPTRVYASPLRRSVESAIVLADAFHVSIAKRACLKEWSPDESGSPQAEYLALERRAWADFSYLPRSQESLAMAAARGRTCLEAIGSENDGRTAIVSGHGTLFSLVAAGLTGVSATEAYKNSIGFAHAAIVEVGSSMRLVRDFRAYGPATS